MNREIKFRCFLKNTFHPKGLMIYPETTEPNSAIGFALFHQLGYRYYITKEHIIEDWQRDMKFMQYTGLKDKNGKEIYEGDILKILCGTTADVFEVGEVGFDEKYLCFYTKCEVERFCVYPVEVIGNIYQTPPLDS